MMKVRSLVVYDVRVMFRAWGEVKPIYHPLQVCVPHGTEARIIMEIAEQQVENNDPSRYGIYAEEPKYKETVISNL